MTPSSYWNRLQRQRISRRRMLAVTGTGAAGLAIAAACGGGTDTEAQPTTASAGIPKYGGRFKNATSAVIDTLDPHLSIAAGTAYFPRIYNVLMAQSPIKPEFRFDDLAEKLEQPDETTWIFSIRPGVKIAPNELDVPERDMDAVDAFEQICAENGISDADASIIQYVIHCQRFGEDDEYYWRRVDRVYEITGVENGIPITAELFSWNEDGDSFTKLNSPMLLNASAELLAERAESIRQQVEG